MAAGNSTSSAFDLLAKWHALRKELAFGHRGGGTIYEGQIPPASYMTRRRETLETFKEISEEVAISFIRRGVDCGRFLAIIVPSLIDPRNGYSTITWDQHGELEGLVKALELASQAPPVTPLCAGSRTFLASEIWKALGISSRTLNSYAKEAGVNTPKRGGRDHRYSTADVVAICQFVIARVSHQSTVEKAKKLLTEIEKETER